MDEFNGHIVKYANEMNDIVFSDFSEQELNMLFALITNMKDRDVKRATFSYSEMKKAMGLGNIHMTNAEFTKKLRKMLIKFCKVTSHIQTKKTCVPFVLFSNFFFDEDSRQICLAVNPNFAFMLNKPKNYTKFQLEEFIRIDGKYAKLLYPHLCQFRTSGNYKVRFDDFRRLLCVPKSYENKRIKEKVINPCLNELRRLEEFKNLQCEVYYSHQNKIERYEFVWKASMKEKEADKEEESAVSMVDVIAVGDAFDDDDLS